VIEYLTAKQTIDDRALNERVLAAFGDALSGLGRAPRVTEVGAGTGTMLARLVRRELLPDRTSYRLVDREPTHVDAARENLPEWLGEAGYSVEERENGLLAERAHRQLRVEFDVADALAIDERADALVGCAFFDLITLPGGLRRLTALLDGGVVYAPITFDGLTAMLPTHPADNEVFAAYHRHMTVREQPGRPDAGRALLEAAPETGGEVLAAGGSDWLVRPVEGTYPADERVVLEHLLATISEAVGELGTVEDSTLRHWTETRHGQLERAELSFLAHNLDVLARYGRTDT